MMFNRKIIVNQTFLLVILFSLLIVCNLEAEDKGRVAVLPFDAIGVSEQDSQVVTSLFESVLVSTDVYTVIEQSQLERILKAQAFSLNGCTDENCAIEAGQLLSAEYIIIGNLSKLGDQYIISAKLIDITLGKSIYSDFIKTDDLEKILEGALHDLVLVVTGQEIEDNKSRVGNKQSSLYFNRRDRNLYWQLQTGGGSILMTGVSWFFMPKLSLDFLSGVSYYSYSLDASTFDGIVGIISSELSWYWFDFFLTPFLQSGLILTTDFNSTNVLAKVGIGLQWEALYINIGGYFLLTEHDVYQTDEELKISFGLKI